MAPVAAPPPMEDKWILTPQLPQPHYLVQLLLIEGALCVRQCIAEVNKPGHAIAPCTQCTAAPITGIVGRENRVQDNVERQNDTYRGKPSAHGEATDRKPAVQW